ncbi:MAG: hypothetical protein O4861_08350 [Trichodesmium sp. St16_bin4-tuft]|nr:hypothetical protein [Trichodesmium sp. MAG_R01]MDE5070340.1 hypothetical protein [Trichodesmium sp. St5_bin8]MDE5077108.1 hypothetical protein [Trichodesmium sp. St2_bin6]MDE5098343.1 hypothetical protein [Trichodesmium sp. St16_bin4-tuft]MDE5104208.1 hypothetical protein [Trichodesmium sp. St19_bin2]
MNIVPTVVETIMECPLCGNHKAHKHGRTFFRKPTVLLSRMSTNFGSAKKERIEENIG